jgi:micrococcal nuclease
VLRRDPYASAMRPIAVLALVLGACTFTEALPVETVVHDSAEVVAVVDGDTLLVAVDGREESVRLIGVNAPERGECLFEEATAALADAVADGFVGLTVDETDRDEFGRLLRYVSVMGEDIGKGLVGEGLAVARRYPPDTARADDYAAAEKEAMAAGLGLWSDIPCGATAGPLHLGAIEPDASGDDGDNPNGEWVEVVNASDEVVSLEGWGLKDESSRHRFAFPPGSTLDPGETVRILSGCGTDTSTVLHWCAEGPVWTNSGDTAFLLAPGGAVVDRLSY